MEALYIIEPGSFLRKDGNTLKILRGDTVLDSIPATGLERLTLVGHVSLTGAVLDFLMKNRIETVFLTTTGRYRGRLVINEHHHVARRQAQYARLGNRDFVLEAARILVRGKLENQVALLMRRARDHGISQLREGVVRIRAAMQKLEDCSSTDAVRGVEGYGTRVYFEMFPFLIRSKEFPFKSRNRRPPRDPFNALLSFVYTLLTGEVQSAVSSVGLDPYLGSLHEVTHKRPSLVCDLVEEWRVLGDRLVLGLVNRQLVSPGDFVIRKDLLKRWKQKEGKQKECAAGCDAATDERESAPIPQGLRPVELKPEASRALLKSFERQMQSSITVEDSTAQLRWLIHGQARNFARFLEDPSRGYKPFRFNM